MELLKIISSTYNWDKFETKASGCRNAICSLRISCARWRARGWTLLPLLFQLLIFLGFLIPFAGSFPTRLSHCTGKFGSLQKTSEHQTIADECHSRGCQSNRKYRVSHWTEEQHFLFYCGTQRYSEHSETLRAAKLLDFFFALNFLVVKRPCRPNCSCKMLQILILAGIPAGMIIIWN